MGREISLDDTTIGYLTEDRYISLYVSTNMVLCKTE